MGEHIYYSVIVMTVLDGCETLYSLIVHLKRVFHFRLID
jgi:hypothetical protein